MSAESPDGYDNPAENTTRNYERNGCLTGLVVALILAVLASTVCRELIESSPLNDLTFGIIPALAMLAPICGVLGIFSGFVQKMRDKK